MSMKTLFGHTPEPNGNPDTPESAEVDAQAEELKEDAGRSYTQKEVEEIVRERLEKALANTNLTPEERRAAALDERELRFERMQYLTEKIQSWGMANIVTPYRGLKGLSSNKTPYEEFRNAADGLLGLWDAKDLDEFKKSVDALFEIFGALIDEAKRRFEAEEEDRQTGKHDAVKRVEQRDVMKEIFKKGGIFN